MFELSSKILRKHCKILAVIGNDREEYEGTVTQIYSNFVELREENGDMIYLSQAHIVCVRPDPEIDEKKPKKLFGR